MANKIVSDSFETLGGVIKSTGQQVKQTVKKTGDDVAESVGLKPADSAGTNEQGGQPQQQYKSDDQMKKMGDESKTEARKKYGEIITGIQKAQQKRTQDIQEYRKPGLTDKDKQEKQIKQLEEKKQDQLPPIPVQRERTKTERSRGVSG